jgi:hypothetical protein
MADDEESVGCHLLEPDLGRILPPGRAARRALRLLRERSEQEPALAIVVDENIAAE